MSRNKRMSQKRQINPSFFVFCEGKTEESYITFLRSNYRIPISIHMQIKGQDITQQHISNYKKHKVVHPKDKTYLIYDIDTPDMLERLQKIKNTILLTSNPCFELWYLLHFQEQNALLSNDKCEQQLKTHLPNYEKGILREDLKKCIQEKQQNAVGRASKLKAFANPSSQLFVFIKDLEDAKKM